MAGKRGPSSRSKPRGGRPTTPRASSSRKSKPRPSPASATQRSSASPGRSTPASLGVDQIARAREVFWHNMMRELLTSLSVLSSQLASQRAAAARLPAPARPQDTPSIDGVAGGVIGRAMPSGDLPENPPTSPEAEEHEEEDSDEEHSFTIPEGVGRERGNVFDGRLAVITSLGQRVPIAEVHPVFACGVRGPDGANLLSTIIECSVFEIRTPGGEVYTLPIHEIKAFHALTPELVEELGKALSVQDGDNGAQPFGFAAFTSLARNQGTLSEVPAVEPEWQGE